MNTENRPHVEIKDATVSTRTFEKDGVKREIKSQQGWFHRGDGAVYEVQVNCRDGMVYAPGIFDLAPSSFQPGKYGRLELQLDIVRRVTAEPRVAAKA